jgi:nucleotide-binding universal stress UspA family protein
MKILLPIDGSDCADDTLYWAARTFDPERTEYYLLFVIPAFPRMIHDEYEVLDADRILTHARKNLELDGGCVVRAEFLSGDPVEMICQYADDVAVDQIVLGSHGRSGIAKLVMGSISEAVLEHAKRPVIIHKNVVRPTDRHSPDSRRAREFKA